MPEAATARVPGFDNEGLTFEVADQGPLDGSPVLLLHGFPQRATCWRRVAPLLHAGGHRTLAPDQRGYAARARPRGRRAYALPHLVADVVALVRRLDTGPVDLVGHDWGGLVGWATAAAHPELVRTLTAVSAPHPRPFAWSLLSSDQAARSWYMAAFQAPFVPELAARSPARLLERGLRRSGMREPEIARFRREVLDDGALTGALGWYRALPLAPLSRPVGDVAVPTTLVWGDRDFAVSRRAAELTAEQVRAPFRLEVLSGVGHWVPEQAAPTLARVIAERSASAA